MSLEVKGQNLPIYVETGQPLMLPAFCMCCGCDTRHTVSLNADPHKQNVALGCFLHLTMFGMIWEAIRLLRQKRVPIPICWQCHRRSILPDPKLAPKVWLFLVMLVATCVLFATNHAGFGLLALLATLAALIPLARDNRAHVREYLPIEVVYSNDCYRYAVYSGPFKKFLASEKLEQRFADQANDR